MGMRLGELRWTCEEGSEQWGVYASRDLNRLVFGDCLGVFHQQPERTVECLERLVKEGTCHDEATT